VSKYTDDMRAAFNLVNAWELGKHFQCPVIYFNIHHPHAIGYSDHRSEVVFFRDGERRKSKEIRIRHGGTLAESRRVHLEAAIEWASKRGLGVEEWAPSGFRDTWIPADVNDRIKAELKEWRKQQREAAKRAGRTA
jgi:hypothetical protein